MRLVLDMANTRPCALMLHGWPRAPKAKPRTTVEYLESRGYDVIATSLFDDTRFSLEGAVQKIMQSLNGRIPDVIMGISFGGLILPHIANTFLRAKLIFLSTGPRLRFRSVLFRLLLPLFRTLCGKILLGAIRCIPLPILLSTYALLIRKRLRTQEHPEEYFQDKHENIRAFKEIVPQTNCDIVRFVLTTDNKDIVKTISNKTLIICGEDDPIMPVELSKELHALIPNSECIVVESHDHATIFGESLYPRLDAFLKD